ILRDETTGEDKRIVDYGGIYYPAHWSPDGKRFLALDFKTNTNQDIYVVDVASEEATLVTPHEGEVFMIPAAWAADGSGFYLLTDEEREFTGLAFHRLPDNTREWVETPEWDVEDAAISPDGRWLAWSVNEDGYSRLYVADLEGDGEARQVGMPDGVLGTMTIAKSGDRMGLLWQRATHPSEVYIVDLGSCELRQITQGALGGLTDEDLTEPELVRYPSFDREIPAFLYKPKGVEGRVPVVLSIHGGPEAQERPQYMYSGFYQYLTSRGIAVLAPNIRGSAGYGKTYQKLIHHDRGGDELKDLEHAALW